MKKVSKKISDWRKLKQFSNLVSRVPVASCFVSMSMASTPDTGPHIKPNDPLNESSPTLGSRVWYSFQLIEGTLSFIGMTASPLAISSFAKFVLFISKFFKPRSAVTASGFLFVSSFACLLMVGQAVPTPEIQ